jgi:ureidoglycolate lyase
VSGVAVEPLTPEAFAPFGALIERPQLAADADGPGWSWWGEVEELPPDPRGYGLGYLSLEPSEGVIDWAEYHRRSHELIVPLGAPCIVYVGPPAPDRAAPAAPELEHLRAFRVEPSQAVLLAPGVWHGAPFADGAPGTALVALAVGTGREDTVVARFPDTPVRIARG